MSNPSDDRSPMAQALGWSSRITAISFEMVVPALIGYWLDRRLGTGMVLVVLGAAVGMITGMLHLIRITRTDSASPSDGKGIDEENLKR